MSILYCLYFFHTAPLGGDAGQINSVGGRCPGLVSFVAQEFKCHNIRQMLLRSPDKANSESSSGPARGTYRHTGPSVPIFGTDGGEDERCYTCRLCVMPYYVHTNQFTDGFPCNKTP